MARVKIAGIDKVRLLEALWARSTSAFFANVSKPVRPKFNKKKAQEHLKSGNGYFDYFCGARIKTDIGGNYADPTKYDDDPTTGPRTFKKIVRKLRKHD